MPRAPRSPWRRGAFCQRADRWEDSAYFAQVRLQWRPAPCTVQPSFTFAWTQLLYEPPEHLLPTSLVVPGALVFDTLSFDAVCALAADAQAIVMMIVVAAIARFILCPLLSVRDGIPAYRRTQFEDVVRVRASFAHSESRRPVCFIRHQHFGANLLFSKASARQS